MRRTIGQSLVGLLGAAILATCGCGDESHDITILCGISFGPPMEKLSKMFEEETGLTVEISFGGSEDLLPNVENHTVGDVFVTHDPFMDDTKKVGAMLRWVHVGYVAPVLVVQKGNPEKLTGFKDLVGKDLKVILPDPKYSTCGEMVFDRLEKEKIKQAL